MIGKNATLLCLFMLSAGTLTFEINLTRLFSVAQFYHFAFMIVSIALLGFGASGTILSFLPSLTLTSGINSPELRQRTGLSALAVGVSILGAYLFTNWLPFDSFSIAWDRKQAALLVLHYLALTLPFFFSGLAVGILLAGSPESAGQTYALNLFGAAFGCLLALVAPPWLGGEGTVALSVLLPMLGYQLTTFIQPRAPFTGAPTTAQARQRPGILRIRAAIPPFAALLLLFCFIDIGLRLAGRPSFGPLEMRLSPYKGLSYALQYPGSQVISRRWNAFSRVDVVRSAGIRSLPGISYRYLESPPPEDGLLIDGDDLSPILRPEAGTDFAAYLPSGVAFLLRPRAEALVLEPRGGLDIVMGLALGAQQITAVEENPLIVSAASHIYHRPQVQVVIESGRSYLHRTRRQFDVLSLSLPSAYHPVRSGAYSLAEDYRYTVEAFADALARLKPDGLLVVTRWLQSPPSECLRTFGLAVTALEQAGLDPRERIVAFRGYNLVTFLIRMTPFPPDEIETIRGFTASRAFDLIYAPNLQPGETNRYNILPKPVYYETFHALLETRPRQAFFRAYPYDVRPPTDNQPFFGHYFKWSQAGEMMAELGRTWQPFGGAGYFVVLALLLLATTLAAGLVLLPALAGRRQAAHLLEAGCSRGARLAYLAYFGLIGLAYLLVEIPLLQRFILFLGSPSYAMTAVLCSLLLFSGLGSRWSGRQDRGAHRLALAGLVAVLAALPLALPLLFESALGLPLLYRLAITGLALAPVGFLMGIPFPAGIQRVPGSLIPWCWAANGAASVISAILAALLALTFGFNVVFWTGAVCYLGAWGGITYLLPASRAQR